MTKFKLKLWLTLTALGLLGIASLLLSELPLDNIPKEITDKIPPATLRLLILINPAFIVILTTLIGTLLYDKVKLTVPVIEKLLNKNPNSTFSFWGITKTGISTGFLAGILIMGISKLFEPYLPHELTDATKSENLNLITKLLYGGITEELMTRFGIMSLFTWIIFKLTKKLNTITYSCAIVLASILFALGHHPIMFQVVAEPTISTYTYILVGNSIGGILFGFSFWKKGLECAFISHAFAHVTMTAITTFIS